MDDCCQNLKKAFFRKKQINSKDVLKTPLSRCLTTLDITLIGIGTTLGSGVYILTGEISRNIAGPAVTLSYLIAAIASILSGLCYAEFAARVPKAGSAYIYSYATMGEFFGFVVGWNLVLEYGVGAAAPIRGFSTYLDSLTGGLIKSTTIEIVGEVDILGNNYLDFMALFISLLIAILLSVGVSASSKVNSFCTITNLLVIIMLITMGLFYAKAENIKDFAPFGVQGIINGASSCFFAFIGFDAVCIVAEEAKNPNKSIPIAIISTISFCFVAYFGVSIVLNMMVPYIELIGDAALSDAFAQVGDHPAKYVIGAGSLFGLAGTSLASCLVIPRFLYAMSSDGLVFEFLSIVNKKTDVPVITTLLSGVCVGLLSFLLNLKDLVEMTSIGTLIAYTLVSLSVLKLRYSKDSVGSVVRVNERSPLLIENEIEEDKEDRESIKESTSQTDVMSFYSDGKTDDDVSFPPAILVCSPTDQTEKRAILFIVLVVCEVFLLSGILRFFLDNIFNGEYVVIVAVVVMVVIVVLTTFAISRLPQNPQRLHFKSPLLPWLPVLALFFNVYLMYGLNQLTWLRFVIWMLLGMLIYFGYGVWYSKERIRDLN